MGAILHMTSGRKAQRSYFGPCRAVRNGARCLVPALATSCLLLQLWSTLHFQSMPILAFTNAPCSRTCGLRLPARAVASNVECRDAELICDNSTQSSVGKDGLPMPGTPPYKARMALLRRISSLDRGANATSLDEKKVRKLAEKLRKAALEEPAWKLSFPQDLSKLKGRWRLLYTSGFVRGGSSSLGGRRPGLPLDNPVAEVSDIFQIYRTDASQADTVVEFQPPRWLRETGILSKLPFATGNTGTELTLTQQFGVATEDSLRFAFVEGKAANQIYDQLPVLRFPFSVLGLPPDVSRDQPYTDTLVTTYCDGNLRLGIGGRFGELRVFQRVR